MALSKAKKQRIKCEREGKMNPEHNRLSWNGLIPVERKTPTWTEQKEKLQRKHKHKGNRTLHSSSDGSLYLFRNPLNRLLNLHNYNESLPS